MCGGLSCVDVGCHGNGNKLRYSFKYLFWYQKSVMSGVAVDSVPLWNSCSPSTKRVCLAGCQVCLINPTKLFIKHWPKVAQFRENRLWIWQHCSMKIHQNTTGCTESERGQNVGATFKCLATMQHNKIILTIPLMFCGFYYSCNCSFVFV